MRLDELKKIAAKEEIPLALVEKDYILTLILAIMYDYDYFNQMAFKGGTAIKKMYFPDARFSEDLDFTCFTDISSALLSSLHSDIEGKKILDIDFREIVMEEATNSKKIIIRYVDYNGTHTNVRLDLSIREKPLLKASLKGLSDIYNIGKQTTCSYLILRSFDDIFKKRSCLCELKRTGSYFPKGKCLNCADFIYDPRIERKKELTVIFVRTLDLEEILAEKIRALMDPDRNLPRDLYDIWFLLGRNVKLNEVVVNRKLELYGKRFEFGQFNEAIKKVIGTWDRDLKPLLRDVPDFETVKKAVIENFFP